MPRGYSKNRDGESDPFSGEMVGIKYGMLKLY